MILALLSFAILCMPCLAQKEALLIANANYAHFPKLPNPIKDALQLSGVLSDAGFNVKILENANRENMLMELSAFEERLKKNPGIAFLHYGGHGIQVASKNYLIPADAEIPDEKRVSTRALDLDEVMSALDASGSTANVVILDACRDNPLPASSTRSVTRGLSVVARKPKNSIIIYAAEAGSAATDGLFTPILSKILASAGNADISEIMKQVRKEVHLQSNGAQTPGEYNQLFERLSLLEKPSTSDHFSSERKESLTTHERGNHVLDVISDDSIKITEKKAILSSSITWRGIDKDGMTKELETVIDGRQTTVKIGLDSPNGTKTTVSMSGLDFAWNLDLPTEANNSPFNEYGDIADGSKYTVVAHDFDDDGSAELIFHISDQAASAFVWIFKSIKNQPYTIEKPPFKLLLHEFIQDRINLENNTITFPYGGQGLFVKYKFINDKFVKIEY